MHLGARDRVHFPESYRGFRLVRTHGRVFAIPDAVDPAGVMHTGGLFTHPAVLSAATLDDVREVIDRFDDAALRPEPLGSFPGYELVRLKGVCHAVPVGTTVDLHDPADRRRAGVLSAASVAELEAAIRKGAAAAPVEFAGWLPIYEVSGNCGKHPQFAHADTPPAGYRFTGSAQPPERRPSRWAKWRGVWHHAQHKAFTTVEKFVRPLLTFFTPERGITLRSRMRVVGAATRLFVRLLKAGCSPLAAVKFLQSRHLRSQLLLGDTRDLVFLTSMPYTYGQNPWVIEIEDPTTLFYPLIQNGRTAHLSLRDSPYFPAVKALLEHGSCKAVLTHMQSTATLVRSLFGSDAINAKLVHSPLGVKLPARWQRHDPAPDGEPLHLLFINSWCQVPSNFYVRGGLDVLEAFSILHARYPHLRLTMRTALPPLADHYHRIIEKGWVRVINRFTTAEEMAELHATSHVFLLPAARVHIVSLLQAMSYGLAVVGSDGWGMREYLDHDRNGLVVEGRHGVVSWADGEAGMLREDYEPMYTPDPKVVAGIVAAVSRLVDDRELRRRLGHAARHDVETTYNLDRWNQGLKAALDLARNGTATVAGRLTVAERFQVPASRAPSGAG